MTRRNTDSSTDSLELLLDTICNTFGAVIFISMLVAILVSNSSRTPSAAEVSANTASDVASIQADIQKSQERLRVISSQVRQQRRITSTLANKESMALAGQLKQQTHERIGLMQQKSAAVQKVVDTKGAAAVLQETLSNQQLERDAAREVQQATSEALRQETIDAARTARIPQVRKTQKTPTVYAIDDGRLYQVTTRYGTVNTQDCEQRSQNGQEIIQPRPTGGMPVSHNTSAAMTVAFREMSAGNDFVQLFVSRDSFEAFLPVKDVLVQLKLEYEVIVTEDDSVTLVLGSSQRESFVQ